MTDAPENIWAHCEPDDEGETFIEYLSDEPWPGDDVGVAYVRKDIADGPSFCPGVWRCAKCEFRLLKSFLNMGDGSVTADDTPGENCPNCDVPMWRVTWESACRDAWHHVMREMGRTQQLEQQLYDEGIEPEADSQPDDVINKPIEEALAQARRDAIEEACKWLRLTRYGSDYVAGLRDSLLPKCEKND